MKLLKIIAVALFVFAAQMSVSAQETPAGKKFAEAFWKAIAEERTYGARSALDSLKQREPGFDAAKLEKALADLEAAKGNRRTAMIEQGKAKNDAGNTLRALFGSYFNASGSSKESEINARIESSRQDVDKILKLDRTTIQKDLDATFRSVQSTLASNDQKNAELIKGVNEAVEAQNAETNYAKLQLRQSYFDNAQRIFPDAADVKAAYTSLTNAINALGSKDQRQARADKNSSAIIDAERMSRSPVRDAKIEKWFKDVFEDAMAIRGRSYTFIKAVVLYPEFTIKRNEVTGVITGRSRGADIGFKDKDGKCKHGIYAIVQEYNGSTYAGGELTMDIDHREMRCENVK